MASKCKNNYQLEVHNRTFYCHSEFEMLKFPALALQRGKKILLRRRVNSRNVSCFIRTPFEAVRNVRWQRLRFYIYSTWAYKLSLNVLNFRLRIHKHKRDTIGYQASETPRNEFKSGFDNTLGLFTLYTFLANSYLKLSNKHQSTVKLTGENCCLQFFISLNIFEAISSLFSWVP